MGFFAVLPIPFDVLDAAITEKLNYFWYGYVEFSRVPVTPCSSSYPLQNHQLGEVGEFRIRKLLDGQSELYVKDPHLPKKREKTEEEKIYLSSKSSQDEKIKAVIEINRNIDKEADELHKRRIKHLHEVADALLYKLKTDPFTWPPEKLPLSIDECLKDYAGYMKTERRMSFWRLEQKGHKWVSRPEQHAKNLLLTFLAGRLGNSALMLEEIRAGAGRVDVFIDFLNGERAVIELKMCGNGYSLNYAQEGLKQIHHYMDNKNAKMGFLLIFDARVKDFGKNIPANEITEQTRIISTAIDVRPSVK